MRAPMTYLIDYDTSQRYIRDFQNIAAFAEASPDLVHVGKTVPILHNWGPVPLIVGENQFTGGPGHTLDRDAVRLLTPEEVEERIAFLKRYTAEWHQTGVPTLLPYSPIHTIAGDHEKREGFWAFYDHWEDYVQWLGPKPAEDPFAWLMVDKNGRFLPGACGGYSPDYFAPLHRYRVCPNHPAWRRYQQRLTQLIAEVGYDGVFVDNAYPHNACFCDHCKRGFKAFVQGLSEREMALLGISGDPADLTLDGENTPPEVVRRYRIASYVDYLKMVRAAGRKVNPEFVVFPNVGSLDTFMPLSTACDYYMFESSGTPGCNLEGPPPQDTQVTIDVREQAAEDEHTQYHLLFADGGRYVELDVTIQYAKTAQVGHAATLSCAIARLGASDRDDDWAQGFAFVLTDPATGREERVAMTPELVVGSKQGDAEAVRPPVTLEAEWTPEHAGRYRLALAYRYSDAGHPETTTDLACTDPLRFDHVYRAHIGELLFTAHGSARGILLDYNSLRKRAENLQELGMAECAAFSSGSAPATKGEPQRKYHRFFERTRALYEGARPYADIGLLYGYCGANPGSMGQQAGLGASPADELAARHRLIQVLLDKTLSADDLAGLKSLVICGSRLEMGQPQVAALRTFVEAGGQVSYYRRNTSVNGTPLEKAIPEAVLWEANAPLAGMPPLTQSRGLARGLRFAAYIHSTGPKRLILHAVNYNVSVPGQNHLATPVRDVGIRLPIPEGWRIAQARLHTPADDAIINLPFEMTGQVLTLALPEVRIYAVVELVAR